MTPWPIRSCVVAAREQIKLTSLHLVINVGKPTSCNPTRSFRCRLGTIESAQSVSQSDSHSLIQSFNCAEQWTCRRAYLSPQVLFFANVKLALFSSLSVCLSVCVDIVLYISLWSSYLLPNHYHEIFHENVCPVPPYVHYLSFSILFDYCMQDKHLSETNSTQLHRCWPPPFTQ